MPPQGLKKIYYSIREVSEITGVEAHVLRFWEKEFPMLRPRRSRSGNRTYKDRDIEIVAASSAGAASARAMVTRRQVGYL